MKPRAKRRSSNRSQTIWPKQEQITQRIYLFIYLYFSRIKEGIAGSRKEISVEGQTCMSSEHFLFQTNTEY